jgi:uncharacterized protein (DUF1330 family)
MEPINPNAEQLQAVMALAAGEADGPIVMLNLNRYRERAAYAATPPGGEPADVSGREAYGRYGLVAFETLTRLGGQILWHAQATLTVIGDGSDEWDEVIAVQYPNTQAFVDLVTDQALGVALAHREAGLERASIVRCVTDHLAVPAPAA